MDIRDWVERGLELLFPGGLYCNCCGNFIDESRTYHLCDHCITHIRWDRGAAEFRKGLPMLRCAQYGIYERTLIFSLKYNRKKYIARDIGAICYDRLQQAGVSFDVVIPVPISKERLQMRGFNQAALVGKYLARRAGVPCLEDGLLRIRNTRPMRGLSPAEREATMAGSIQLNEAVREEICGKRILLFDDFYTTGSTALECHKALLCGGPKEVVFLAFAAK